MQERRSIDDLATQKSHLDFSRKDMNDDFGLEGYKLCTVLDDIILAEFIDVVSGEGGDCIERNGILVPMSQTHQAWRKAVVRLKGVGVTQCNVGDVILFPQSMGIKVSNLDVDGVEGKLKDGIFLNENRIFGVAEKLDNE
jgi:hypothetical protein